MKIKRLHIKSAGNFKLLYGFDQSFYSNNNEYLQPLCLVGVNGSGKSQLLEVLAEIFYALDAYYNNFQDKKFETDILFEIEYLIKNNVNQKHICISRLQKGPPKVYLISSDKKTEIENSNEISEILPTKIIGYTSGENETLSIPYKDSYDDYADYVTRLALNPESAKYSEVPDSRLLFLDYNANISIFVSNFLLRQDSDLKIFSRTINVQQLRSFRIIIQLNHQAAPGKNGIELTRELEDYIKNLKKCATCYNHIKDEEIYTFDYYVNDATKSAFKNFFKNAFKLYTALYKIKLLNNLIIKKKDLQNIKKLRKEHKLVLKPPTVPETDKVFRFENVKLKIKMSNDPVDYVSLSDGEHQFIQIFGSLMMIDDDGILFLMDEPESHFNPKWRSLFMTVLKELKKKKEQCIFVTSHSPFILSDFHSETVYIFKLTNKGIKIEQPQEETYGASFDRLLKIAFDISPPLADKSLKEIRTLQKSNNKDHIAKKMPRFGDSIEKFYLYQRIEELSEQEKK